MAHEQHSVPGAKSHHEYIPPAKAKPGEPSGYVEKEYEHQEYPKYVDGVLVKDAKEEKALAAKAKAADAAPKSA